MSFQWKRLPASDAAGTATADTTETQIGTGITVPTWARSILAAHFQLCTLALTTKEEVTGYFKIVNDNNTIEPLNFPMPMSVCLTGAIGTHISPLALTVPCFSEVTPNDIVRVYMALNAASTGVHTAAVELLFSDKSPPMKMHSAKSAATAFGQTAGTLTTAVSLETIAGRSSAVIGIGSDFLVYPTAAETFGGHIIVKSDEKGWQEQRLPVTTAGSGLSTQITPFTLPVMAFPLDFRKWFDQVVYVPFPDPFPVPGRASFSFQNTPIMDQSVAGAGRYFLYWRE